MAALASSTPEDRGDSFLDWLKRRGQTPQAIDRFWKTILVSALNEELDQVSIPYAAQVVRESFLKSAAAGAWEFQPCPSPICIALQAIIFARVEARYSFARVRVVSDGRLRG